MTRPLDASSGIAATAARTPMRRARSLLVEGPRSFGAWSRRRRWELFRQFFPDVGDMSVLDLGGTVETWLRAPVRPRDVLVVNLAPPAMATVDSVRTVQGDACELPATVTSRRFDLVFSNSLIEHVGGHHRRRQLAENVHNLARRHWVQTPYRYFPIEPHWLFPGFQFLPVRLRASIARRWPLVHTPPIDHPGAVASVMETELLSVTEMSAYFPESTIVRERLGPLTKSIAAVRR